MSRPIQIALIGVLFFGLAALAWWLLTKEEKALPVNTVQVVPGKVEIPPSPPSVEPASPTPPAPSLSEEEKMKKAFEAENTTLQFWGQAVDQDNLPLEGVKIVIQTREVTGYYREQFQVQTLFSSADGTFELVPVKGKSLTIKAIEKEGYELSKETKMSYGYKKYSEVFTPDPNHPVVFKMWKRSLAEPLRYFHKSTRIPYDGTSVVFDLLRGDKTTNPSSGDIRITLLRTPLKITWGQQNFAWVAKVDAISGGIIETTEEVPSQAPESGYGQSIEIKMAANDPHWSPNANCIFYLKSRDGKCFSFVNLKLVTDSDQENTGMVIDSYLNPASSRVLRYDPGMVITREVIEQMGLEKAIEQARGK